MYATHKHTKLGWFLPKSIGCDRRDLQEDSKLSRVKHCSIYAAFALLHGKRHNVHHVLQFPEFQKICNALINLLRSANNLLPLWTPLTL